MWPSQPSSKWWRLCGVLWGFGAAQESLSQAQGLGQGGTCSTLSHFSLAGAPLLLCSALSPNWQRRLGERQKTKDPSFTWEEMRKSGFSTSPWNQSGGKCQLPRLTMEFSSGFHSVCGRRVHLWDDATNCCTVSSSSESKWSVYPKYKKSSFLPQVPPVHVNTFGREVHLLTQT